MIADRYFWICVCPETCPDAPICWRVPPCTLLARWVEELPRGRPIAVYCICGFQVSGKAVAELRQRGYDARAVVGGITAWHAIGGTTVPLDTSTYEEAP